ncbi:MAG: metallophosphoesterase [Cyanobacteria bacterium SID2]|nr:metallophosphoesterase [Cyanobacteria bacterium SID2]MBP0003263.1 metallophosphoesterase [Cyanobacteria bacterium SBC]
MSNLLDIEALSQYPERSDYGIRNLFSLEQLQTAIADGDREGLTFDLNRIADSNTGLITLLDGSTINPQTIYGTVFVGPYPFESEETDLNYKRFRESDRIEAGRATIETTRLTQGDHNSEGWTNQGTVAVRLTLLEERDGQDRVLGDNVSTYDTFAAFRLEGDTTRKLASFIEPPAVNMIRSDAPGSAVISLETASPVPAAVEVVGIGTFSSGTATHHEIPINGLAPDTKYEYRVTVGSEETAITVPSNHFTTAPLPGQLPRNDGKVGVLFMSDSREGVPEEGLEAFMGTNAGTLSQGVYGGYTKGADVMIFGGDLVNGYTVSPEDFSTQLEAWKQTVAPFQAERPVYPAMGNHESLLRNYDNSSRYGISVDRFDANGSYATESSEAAFAAEFVNPQNGPQPSDPARPTYTENLYSFQYGPTKFIAFNNNYWVSYASAEVGGNPEGYMFQDQLNWIERELDGAESDPSVRYVVLYAQEPVFPSGGHVDDAMWYTDKSTPELEGDNNVRAYIHNGEKLVPEEKGILEVRDQFTRMVAEHDKVAAVMTGDEHAYHRVLIDPRVPVGDVTRDDANGNNIVGDNGEMLSPLSDLENPVWYITAGSAGAPYYSEEQSPWQEYWKSQPNPEEGFKYSSQESYVILNADAEKISMELYSTKGELIDKIDDLMAVKRNFVDRFNQVNGDGNANVLSGTAGDDAVIGGFSAGRNDLGDELYADAGNDRIYGNGGDDRLEGQEGNDNLYGGQGNDTLLGDVGDDDLSGEMGDDLLTGGAGADRFILQTMDGTDTITDFEDGVDTFLLKGSLSYEQLSIVPSDGGAAINFNGQILATVSGISAEALNASDFVV